MKKLLLLTKTLLAAALLCVGQNAWGVDTPYNISSTESAYVDATDDASKAATHNGASLDNLITYYTQTRNWESKGNTCNTKFNAGGKLALYKFPLSSVKSETGTLKSATLKVTINSTGDGKNVSKLGIFGYNGPQDWTGATLTFNNLSNTGADAFGYTVDYSASYPILDVNNHDISGGPGSVVSASALTYVQSALTAGRDYISFAVSNNSTRVTNLNVTATLELVFSSATATTYTIEFKNAGGDALKTAAVYDIFEGESFTASASDMATFYNNDFTMKYTYNSGNSVETAVADAASNVITLVFDEATNTQYTHTINATGSLAKAGIASITLYEGQSGTVYYNKYVQDDSGNWHYTNTNGNSGSAISYGVYVSGAGSTNKTYTASDITFFTEVEDMYKSGSHSSSGTASRASKGVAPRIRPNGYVFTDPIAAGGTFNITLGGRGVSNDATVELYVADKVSDTAVDNMVSKGTFSSWSNGGISEITINDVVVEPGQVIVLKNPISGNACYVETDYMYYKKTADYTVSITPATAKSTYVTTYALDFTDVEGLDAYVATAAANGSVTLEEVGAVPAGTPLMLIGTAGTEYSVPVVASADAPETNMFRAGDGTTGFDGTTFDYILYTDGLFYQIGSGTVATNKAYLHCTSDPTTPLSRELSISFGGVTGVENVEAASETVVKEGKFVEGNQLFIYKKGVKFNAAGQQVK